MTKKLPSFLLGFLIFVALLSTFLFFKTMFSDLAPEFLKAEGIPLGLFSGLTLVALAIAVRNINR